MFYVYVLIENRWRESVIQADREKYTGTDMTLVDLDEEPEQERDGSEVEWIVGN